MATIDIEDVVAELKRRRGSAKSALTRIQNYVKTVTADTPYENIAIRLESLEKGLVEFKEYDERLLEYPNTTSDIVDFENKYFDVKAKLKKLMNDRLNHASDTLHNQMNDTFMRFADQQRSFFESFSEKSTIIQERVRLPKVSIPPFSGNYAEFPSFKDLYVSSIHNNTEISNVVKFQYLKGFLRDDALSLIRHITVTDANYKEAWEKILNRFDKKKSVVKEFVKKFMDQPQINQPTQKNLRRICDISDEVMRGLKALGREAEQRDPWLIFILLSKIDQDTREQWAKQTIKKDFPTIHEFLEFLNDRCDALENSEIHQKRSTPIRPVSNMKVLHAELQSTSTQVQIKCLKCKMDHYLYKCDEYLKLLPDNRRELIAEYKLCFNCLSPNHSAYTCTSRRTCMLCNRRHHTTLHGSHSTTKPKEPQNVNVHHLTNESNIEHSSNDTSEATSLAAISESSNKFALLPTALVRVNDIFGNPQICRAVLDSGSQASLISESCMQRLKLKRKNARITVSGIASKTISRGSAKISMHAHFNSTEFLQTEVLILEKLTSVLPKSNLVFENPDFLKDLNLADPTFNQPGGIDILLGAGVVFQSFRDGRKTTANIVAQNTIFGWVIAGNLKSCNTKYASTFHLEVDIDRSLQKFWELEEETVACLPTEQEIECENHFVKTHRRDERGRYEVRLPFTKEALILGNSFNCAYRRFMSMERKMQRNPELKSEYVKFMAEYEELGHMIKLKIPSHTNENNHFYLPHHAVIKDTSTTTKVRVVFDGSCKSSTGVSLNSKLLVGPTIQPKLATTLLNFRFNSVAFIADIEKMYRQIKVHPEDAEYQRILWRDHPSKPLEHFKLTTVTYGTASAPFLAIRSLQQLSQDLREQYPAAAEIVLNDFYVDDLLSGADNIEDGLELKTQITTLLRAGGFPLRKWRSNVKEISDFQENECGVVDIQPEDSKEVKVLGLQWNSSKDYFSFTINFDSNVIPTKRAILSESAKLFDPLGWLSPVVIVFKLFLQRLWILGISWDEKLSEELVLKWKTLMTEMPKLEELKIPRYIPFNRKLQSTNTYIETNSKIQIHGFSDASENAYSAVLYVRIIDDQDQISVHLLTSKTKVAPVKQVSLPRLELCGAHLLSKMFKRVKADLKFEDIDIHFWTDSTIVLTWLADHPRRWKTFVANRTADILNILPRKNWHHVRSTDNPADCASRGMLPSKLLQHDLWWQGPNWLSQPIENWPNEIKYSTNEEILLKEEKQKLEIFTATVSDENFTLELIFSKYSSLMKIIRVIAYCKRFAHNEKCKSNKRSNYLTSDELKDANIVCVKWAQNSYSKEINLLLKTNKIHKKSNIITLSPFVDSSGVLRVGGRLQNAMVSYDAKHPIILPKHHIFSQMIISYYHMKYLHPGATLLAALVKQQYWIVHGRSMIRFAIKNCLVCYRVRAETSKQLMGVLPAARVTPSRVFLKTGIDFAGPISIINKRGRGAQAAKGYIAVFVCMAIKAVHLEAVSDLSTDAFLAALRRFVSRRGLPTDLYTDNGTNFIGARRKLDEISKLHSSQEFNSKMSEFMNEENIRWHFIPPTAAHAGGLWESSVKSVKHHLLRATTSKKLTFEELQTMLCQIESILNSRPLCPVSEDVTDLNYLTPGHFIIMAPLTAVPENSILDENVNRLKIWQAIQQQIQIFWKRYKIEYLNILQQRNKWQLKEKNIEIGELVAIREDNSTPLNWQLGRITEVHPGTDGLVRVVTVKTSKTKLKRPITKICRLPIENPSNVKE